MIKFRLLLGIYLLWIPHLSANNLAPVLVEGRAEFGPETPEAIACKRAVSNAKTQAMREVFGEVVGQKSVLACDRNVVNSSGNDCELFENTWSLLNTNGFIKEVFELNRKIERIKGRSVCYVSAEITIEAFDGKPDVAFETQITVTQGFNLRLDDHPVFAVQSNAPAYHYVYFWAPYVDSLNYYRLFPNTFDDQSEKKKRLTIPSNEALKAYEFEVTLPEGMDYSHEYLILISSKTRLEAPPEKITETNFFRWLKGFKRNQWTQSKFNYRVLGDSSWQT